MLTEAHAPSNATLPTFPHFFGLDLLRFIAAAMVAVMHLNTAAISPNAFAQYVLNQVIPDAPKVTPPSWAYLGTLGVQVFFVISGFLISQSASKSRSAGHFLTLRAIRLVPALWICSAIGFLIIVSTGYAPPGEATLRLLRSLVLSPVGRPVDNVVWTLVLEVTFYSGIALLLALGRLHHLPAVAAVMATLCTLYWVGYFWCNTWHPSSCFLYDNRWMQKMSSILLVQHGVFFAIGMTLSLLTTAHTPKVHVLAKATLALALLGSCLQVIWVADFYATHFATVGAPQSPLTMLLTWMVFLGAILKFSLWPSRWTPQTRVVPAFRLLGLSSYPLYLSHNTVGALLLVYASTHVTHTSALVVSVVGTAVWSSLLVYAFEVPLQSWLKRRLFTRTPTTGQARHPIRPAPP